MTTAPFPISSCAFVAARPLSDFVSIHSTLILRPSTPPALLISSIRIWNACPGCRSYGASAPVLAAEIPIRIGLPAALFAPAVPTTAAVRAPIARTPTSAPSRRRCMSSPPPPDWVPIVRNPWMAFKGRFQKRFQRSLRSSLRGPAAVDEQRRAVHVPRRVRREEDRRGCDVLYDADTAGRSSLDHDRLVFRRLEIRLVHRRVDVSRCDRIHPDV